MTPWLTIIKLTIINYIYHFIYLMVYRIPMVYLVK